MVDPNTGDNKSSPPAARPRRLVLSHHRLHHKKGTKSLVRSSPAPASRMLPHPHAHPALQLLLPLSPLRPVPHPFCRVQQSETLGMTPPGRLVPPATGDGGAVGTAGRRQQDFIFWPVPSFHPYEAVRDWTCKLSVCCILMQPVAPHLEAPASPLTAPVHLSGPGNENPNGQMMARLDAHLPRE
jgi:hypothetical protein